MRCPRCTQRIHRTAEECPHCGATMEAFDEMFAHYSRRLKRPHDVAGALKVKERRVVERWINQAEKKFPQLFFAVAIVALEDEFNLQSYGCWLLNRGEIEFSRTGVSEEGGVLLVIDVKRKQICPVYGYLLDDCVDEEGAFGALVKAHPYLLEGDMMRAIEALIKGMASYLKKCSRRAPSVVKKKKLKGGQA